MIYPVCNINASEPKTLFITLMGASLSSFTLSLRVSPLSNLQNLSSVLKRVSDIVAGIIGRPSIIDRWTPARIRRPMKARISPKSVALQVCSLPRFLSFDSLMVQEARRFVSRTSRTIISGVIIRSKASRAVCIAATGLPIRRF